MSDLLMQTCDYCRLSKNVCYVDAQCIFISYSVLLGHCNFDFSFPSGSFEILMRTRVDELSIIPLLTFVPCYYDTIALCNAANPTLD